MITDERDGGMLSRQGSMASSSVASLDNNNKSEQQQSGERGVDVGRVASWATDFEKLLADPVGLQTFAVSKHNV